MSGKKAKEQRKKNAHLFDAVTYWEFRCGISERLAEQTFEVLRAMAPAGTPASDAMTRIWNQYQSEQKDLKEAFRERFDEALKEANKPKIFVPGDSNG